VLEKALQILLGSGPLGVVIVGMGYWIHRLQKKLDEVQDARVENALKYASISTELGATIARNTEVLRRVHPEATDVAQEDETPVRKTFR
jgi:hypothetical protein